MNTATTPAPAKGRLEIDTTRERLTQLGLSTAAAELSAELSEAVKNERSAHQVLDRLLEKEIRLREERRIRTSLKLIAVRLIPHEAQGLV
jgi:DNA replication protein DnaC